MIEANYASGAIKTYYLSGPMSGIAQFNFPAFIEAAADLRARGFNIISPAELDAKNGIDVEAMASTDGDAGKLTQTWGDLLSRDVKIVADECTGMIFLPNWCKSRGAKLEAYVGLLQKEFEFYEYHGARKPLLQLTTISVLADISASTL